MDEKLIKAYKDKWFQIGTDYTTGTNRELAEEALKEIYIAAGFEPPKDIYWEASPFAGVNKVIELKKASGLFYGMTDKALAYQAFYECLYGQQDSGWLAFYDYMIEEEKDETIKKKMSGQVTLAKCGGWTWVYDTCAVISEKPVFISLDKDNRLHNKDKRAVEYSDGTGFYVWHGVQVPNWFIEDKEEMTTVKIFKEKDPELKKIMVQILGDMSKKTCPMFKVPKKDSK